MKRRLFLLLLCGWMLSIHSLSHASEWSIYDKTSAMLELSKPKLIHKLSTNMHSTMRSLQIQRLNHMKKTYQPKPGVQMAPKENSVSFQQKKEQSMKIYSAQQKTLETKYQEAKSKLNNQGFSKIWTQLGKTSTVK